ncbi:MAG: aminotransferase class I/II-fold pyridoxal phosphate-dependent enzyme [Hyphomicrobiales bacterium]
MSSALSDGIVSSSKIGSPASLSLPGSPFQRLATLLQDIKPGMSPIELGVGEPRHDMPAFVGRVLSENLADFQRYPPIKGSRAFRQSVSKWLDRRYELKGTIDPESAILPLNGSREGLFFALFEARRRKPVANPLVYSPNPFYQTYAAAAGSAGCQFLSPPEFDDPRFEGLPDFNRIEDDALQNTVAVYIASPANPQGNSASSDYWTSLIQLALKHDFMIFADECYSEIYRDAPPSGILEAAQNSGSFANVICFNSLSKRSNLAGLRAGFMAGDQKFIANLTKFRNMAAPQVPLPVQAVAAAAFEDEDHVVASRKLYNKKFDIATEILSDVLPFATPEGGFFLWLDCQKYASGETMALHLWKEAGLKVVPGSYLTADDTDGNGRQHNKAHKKVRLALVHDIKTTTEALTRFKSCLDNMQQDMSMAADPFEQADR